LAAVLVRPFEIRESFRNQDQSPFDLKEKIRQSGSPSRPNCDLQYQTVFASNLCRAARSLFRRPSGLAEKILEIERDSLKFSAAAQEETTRG
jgi:hypothetical protein